MIVPQKKAVPDIGHVQINKREDAILQYGFTYGYNTAIDDMLNGEAPPGHYWDHKSPEYRNMIANAGDDK